MASWRLPSVSMASPLLLLLLVVLLAPPISSAPAPPPGYIFIDCGAAETPVAGGDADVFTVNDAAGNAVQYRVDPAINTTTAALAPAATPRLTPAERSLRAFPTPGGCYALSTLTPGNWSIRPGFAYYNYDRQGMYPAMLVNINGATVDQFSLSDWESPRQDVATALAPSANIQGAHYTEYVVELRDGKVEICFASLDGEASPILNSLELVPYTPNVMPEVGLFLPNASLVLSLKHRITLGGPEFGPSVEEDPLLRRWHAAGPGVLTTTSNGRPRYTNLTSRAPVKVVPFVKGQSPPPVSQRVFQTALQGGPIGPGFQFLALRFDYVPVDPTNLLMARLFFSELNDTVRYGQRVFNISFGTPDPMDPTLVQNMPWMPSVLSFWFDIMGAVDNETSTGFYMTQAGCYPYPLPGPLVNTMFLVLTGEGSQLPPAISGVELYEVIITDDHTPPPCVPSDVSMQQQGRGAPGPGAAPGTSAPPVHRPAAETGPVQPGSSVPVHISNPTAGNRLSPGAIVGIVIAVVVVVAALTAGLVYYLKKRTPEARATSFQRFQADEAAGPL